MAVRTAVARCRRGLTPRLAGRLRQQPLGLDTPPLSLYTSHVHKEFKMPGVNVTTLRQHLPAYLARVARGERLSVTLRGRVIAEISPPTPQPDAAEAARGRLKGSLLRYDQPLEPVLPADDWDMNR